jgi:antitoxin component YwqK of YwqJK toxin-antitoxin module
MKKGFFTILLFLPTLLLAQADSLKGDIKSIREKLIFLDSTKQNMKLFSSEGDYGHYGFSSPEFTFSRFNSWWFNTPWVHYLNYLRNYDTSKNLLEEIWYYKSDAVLEKITYDYDEENNLVQEKTEFDDTTFFVKSSYYNDLGLHLSSISYSSFKPLRYEYESYSYDENKRVIEIKKFDEYGESYGTKFNYTNSGKVKEKISHSPFVWVQLDKKSKGQKRDKIGNDQLQEERIYDSTDKLIKVNNYIDDFDDRNKAVLSRSTSYKYDSKNRKIGEYYAMSSDTVDAFREYQYYENNLLKKEKFIRAKNNSVATEIEYQYDRNNNIVKVIYINEGKTSLITFTYKFDNKQNWIEQLKSVDGKPLYLRKRELKYY